MTAKSDYDAGWEAGRNTGMLLAQQQQPIIIRVETAQAATQPRRRWYLQKRWLLSAIFAALLLFGGLNQRAKLGSLIDKYVSPAHVQVGSQRIDSHTFATAAVAIQGRILATIVPTVGELPQATPIPTLGRAATVPQQDEPTPVAAQMPPDNGQHDVQPGNMPAVQAPPPPVEQAAPAVEAPPQPAPPTAAPTAEPEGEVVAQSQDVPVNANGEPAVNYELEAQKMNAVATAKAFTEKWQGVKP